MTNEMKPAGELTDEQIDAVWRKNLVLHAQAVTRVSRTSKGFARAIIAADRALRPAVVEPLARVVHRKIPAGHDTPECTTFDVKWLCVDPFKWAGNLYGVSQQVAGQEHLVERLKQEAKIHAQEAKTANATVYEIYQCITGATGEPGSWHGAEPVRAALAAKDAEIACLTAERDALLGKTPAARDVMAERQRQRQISVEGWTPEMDDSYSAGDMASAAGCYATQGRYHFPVAGKPGPNWPFHADWWRPSSYRRNLVKAGALLLAEIERLDRAAMTKDTK